MMHSQAISMNTAAKPMKNLEHTFGSGKYITIIWKFVIFCHPQQPTQEQHDR